METFFATTRRAVFRLAEAGAALSALYHRARLLGTEHLATPLVKPGHLLFETHVCRH